MRPADENRDRRPKSAVPELSTPQAASRCGHRRPDFHGKHLALCIDVSAVLIVLFFVTFLFDTRVGLVFLAAAILLLYRGAPHRRGLITSPPHEKRQPAWKDPWGTGRSE